MKFFIQNYCNFIYTICSSIVGVAGNVWFYSYTRISFKSLICNITFKICTQVIYMVWGFLTLKSAGLYTLLICRWMPTLQRNFLPSFSRSSWAVFDVATKYRRVMWINKGSHIGNGPSVLWERRDPVLFGTTGMVKPPQTALAGCYPCKTYNIQTTDIPLRNISLGHHKGNDRVWAPLNSKNREDSFSLSSLKSLHGSYQGQDSCIQLIQHSSALSLRRATLLPFLFPWSCGRLFFIHLS
jgi:hypothetical protein